MKQFNLTAKNTFFIPVVKRLRQVCNTVQGTKNEPISTNSKSQKSRIIMDSSNCYLEDKLSSVSLFGVSCTKCQFKATSVHLLENHENEKHVKMFHKNRSIFDDVYPKSDWCDVIDDSLKNEFKNGFIKWVQ